MNLIKIISFLLLASCSAQEAVVSPTPPSPPKVSENLAARLAAVGPNVMEVSVSGTLCGSHKYINEPCVKITLCEPGTNTCQTIDNILLDTGSYGLRVFKSVVTDITLPNVLDSSNKPYATCALFGSGADWGSVHKSDVILGDLSLGGEKAPSVSVQLIDDTYFNAANNCSNGEVDHSPADAYFNGILGVGLFAQDCGVGCTVSSGYGMYYSCASGTCTGARISLTNQVTNPVFLMPTHNNGSILSLPDVSSAGADNVTGTFILGINTASNNVPESNLYFLQANSSNAYITATYNSVTTNSLLDSGTNGYAFASTIPNCSVSSSFYCPSSTLNLTSVQRSSTGVQVQVDFKIANAYDLLSNNSYYVFNNVGFELSSGQNFFIYGLPFHLGKSVYMGLEGRSSSLGSGMFWAY